MGCELFEILNAFIAAVSSAVAGTNIFSGASSQANCEEQILKLSLYISTGPVRPYGSLPVLTKDSATSLFCPRLRAWDFCEPEMVLGSRYNGSASRVLYLDGTKSPVSN